MSNIIGKQYNPYAMPSGTSGLITGMELGNKLARQRGLAAGMQKVANGDESGWKDIAAVAPDVYLKHQEDTQLTPYQREELAIKRKQLEQNQLEKKFNTTNEIKNYNALVEMGVDPDKARDIAFKQMNNDIYTRTMQIQEAKDRAELEHKIKQLESGIPEFQKMADKLNDLGKDATYTYLGKGWDTIARQVGYTTAGAKAREGYKQTVSNELLPTLKDTFGSQLSDQERESLLSTLGNIDLSPKEKRAAVDAFMEAKKRQLKKYKSELEKYGVDPKESTETPKKPKYTIKEIKE